MTQAEVIEAQNAWLGHWRTCTDCGPGRQVCGAGLPLWWAVYEGMHPGDVVLRFTLVPR